MIDPLALTALVLWGTLAGVDLVSFPQGMLNRPIVAATVAGLILGDLAAPLMAGVLLECFALDVLPIGASRYPDYGPAAVVAGFGATIVPWEEWLGAAVLLGLVVAVAGGRAMDLLRRWNGRQAVRAAPALAEGDPRVIAALQRGGLLADGLRSAVVTAGGLAAAALVLPAVAQLTGAGQSVTLVVVAGALVAALTGSVRRAPTGVPRLLLLAGLAAGGGIVWLG